MTCPQCQHENPAGAKFCNSCGAKLEASCPQCEHTNPSGSRFCNACGASLTSPPQPPVPSSRSQVPGSSQSPTPEPRPPVSYTPPHLAARIQAEREALEARRGADGERKSITALFADIKGSTDLIA